MKWMLLFLLFVPSVAFAEVSDKMPSITEIIIKGIVIAVVVFFAGRFKWWLGVLLLPITVLFVVGAISLWNEVGMREALLKEQGWVYFGALGLESFLIGLATVVGAIIGFKKQAPNKALNSQPPAAGTPKNGAH